MPQPGLARSDLSTHAIAFPTLTPNLLREHKCSLTSHYWQTLLTPQTPEKQSEACRHVLPVAHVEQAGPPQSVSVSFPFLTPSVQVATVQMLPTQFPELQSACTRHALPAAHVEQVGPPQSVSVSFPFLTPSVQVGAAVGVQTPFEQMLFVPHTWPQLPQFATFV
jgi:predicted component of type VI protein secretion system